MKRPLVIAGLVALAFLCVGAVALVLIGKSIMEEQAMDSIDPEDRELFERWQNEVIFLAPGVLDVEPYSKELKAASARFQEEWNRRGENAQEVADSYTGDPKYEDMNLMDDADLEPQLEKIEELRPLIEAFEAMVRVKGFQIDASVAGIEILPDGRFPVTRPAQFKVMVRLVGFEVIDFVRRGMCNEALNKVRSCAVGAKIDSHAHDLDISSLYSMLRGAKGLWRYAIDRCAEPEILRRMLEDQNDFAAHRSFPQWDDELFFSDSIQILRSLKRRGIQPPVRGLTRHQLLATALIGRARYLNEVADNSPNLDDEVRRKIRSSAATDDSIAGVILRSRAGNSGWMAALAATGLQASYFSGVIEIYRVVAEHTSANLPKYFLWIDETRIATAQKLFEFQRGRAARSVEELVPDYLPSTPLDPFSNEREVYRGGPPYYSIGPNGEDDGGKLIDDAKGDSSAPDDITLDLEWPDAAGESAGLN